ncbi:hypothetical protein GLOTRDRAFT_133237 [Gloeophyllum trabeum ATCC 11539]|uniref:Uncharacterized protein n=1 Tax=Gloeophyllum trabeum (strain ATCC 11539 / FP-39264 / Madison 617) TaxID=670483 RepID=S7PVE7_GLOTA|nr:uncharacterized protein GLOTRDRAFT_133237 [Gloeophyllum trabeum ATCC 11539]EPQ51372.1 hypothetical protein GLOTRDRAFT_133237 [Gloeophyllum trabeum ATCC 11539]
MNASTPVIDTRCAMCEVDGLPEGQGEARVGGTDDGNANDGCGDDATLNGTLNAFSIHGERTGAPSVKDEKQSPATAEERPVLLKGWKLESEAEYARRIGRDVREVKEEMLRKFEESLANKDNNLPSGFQLPVVFRPSPASQPRDSQIPAIATGDHGVEQCRLAEGNEDDDYESVSDDESVDLEYDEVISPEEAQEDINGTNRRGRVRYTRRSIGNKQGISPLPTPESGYLADRTVSREWMATFDVDADTTLPSLTTYIRILEACEARRR